MICTPCPGSDSSSSTALRVQLHFTLALQVYVTAHTAAQVVQAMPKHPIPILSDEEIQAAATFVVKRFLRKFHKHGAVSQIQSSSAAVSPLLRSTAKAPGLPVPPHCNPDLPLRISDPPIALQSKGVGKHAIRMPCFAQGGLQPPLQQAKGDFAGPPIGGRPCPQPRPVPRSLRRQTQKRSNLPLLFKPGSCLSVHAAD